MEEMTCVSMCERMKSWDRSTLCPSCLTCSPRGGLCDPADLDLSTAALSTAAATPGADLDLPPPGGGGRLHIRSSMPRRGWEGGGLAPSASCCCCCCWEEEEDERESLLSAPGRSDDEDEEERGEREEEGAGAGKDPTHNGRPLLAANAEARSRVSTSGELPRRCPAASRNPPTRSGAAAAPFVPLLRASAPPVPPSWAVPPS